MKLSILTKFSKELATFEIKQLIFTFEDPGVDPEKFPAFTEIRKIGMLSFMPHQMAFLNWLKKIKEEDQKYFLGCTDGTVSIPSDQIKSYEVNL